ncbi:hypothetical protein COOONC_08674 [Cooperia oncophora]
MTNRANTAVVMVDPKKQPAKRTGKEEELLSNFWELSVSSKTVYRYDVAVYLGTRDNSRAVNFLRGPRDDSASVARRRACLCALQLILERYDILNDNSAVIYDGSAIMFSSEDLASALKKHHGILSIDIGDLPVQLSKQTRFFCPSGEILTIEICRCRDAAASFDIADLSAQMNRNWATIDRSWKQFYELLVSQDAVSRGRFTQYGIGCLYSRSASGDVGCGFEKFTGARKGIKFIEGKRKGPKNVVPALILDHRTGVFFKNQSLMKSIREIEGLQRVDRFDFSDPNNRMNPIFIEGKRKGPKNVVPALILDHRTGVFFKNQSLMKSIREIEGLQRVDRFDFSDPNNRMNPMWNKVNNYVKGVRMIYAGSTSKSISSVAIGISKVPIKDVKDSRESDQSKTSILASFSSVGIPINPHWPAVKLLVRNKVLYYPMELLQVDHDQRVPA